MKRRISSTRFAPGLGCILFCFWLATAQVQQAQTGTVSFTDLPAAAQKTVQEQLRGGKVGEIDSDEQDGEACYTVTIARAGQEQDVTVAVDGRLLSVEVELAETPVAVQKTIQTELRGGTLDSVEKAFEDDGGFRYEVDTTTKDGADRAFAVAADGNLVSMQVTLEELPAAVRKTIQEHAANGTLGDIYRMFEGSEISYTVEMTRNGKDREFSVTADGKLESVRVFPAELPALGQKTLRETIGTGKLVRIDKTVDDSMFHIESRKDGKPFDFKIGPGGRFRGMED